MKDKLFNLPMVKGYVITTAIGTFPFILTAAIAIERLTSAAASVDAVRAEVDNASIVGGKLAANQIATTAAIPNVAIPWIVATFFCAVFAGAFIRRMLSDRALRTSNELVSQARAAASGDLRIDPVVESTSEYGQLQHGFGAMVRDFRETITRIDRAAVDLRQASDEMAHTADEAGGAIGEVAQAIGAISEGASHQVSLISLSARLVAGIEASVRDTSEHALEAQEQSAATERLADEGMQCASEVQDAMRSVRESSLSTASVIRSLGEKSADIDHIVQAIAGIAQQTNMLALNASIEAARAGEQGKGFANVAEEVRLLAEDAQLSAEEIAVLIREIQAQTAQAVSAMEEGVQRVEEGFATVNGNRQTFRDVSNAVRELHESSTEISGLAQGISEGTGRVREQIEAVASVAEESSAATEQVSASTQESSAAADEVSASAQRVAATAATLAALSGRFKLPDNPAFEAAKGR